MDSYLLEAATVSGTPSEVFEFFTDFASLRSINQDELESIFQVIINQLAREL
jgi:hypothetical protein